MEAEKWRLLLRTCRRRIGGILFVSALALTSQSGFITMSLIYLPCFIMGLPMAQWVFDTIMSMWFALAVGIYELIYGVKVVIQGDVRKLNKNKCTLIIMNHRTRLDWLFYFSVQSRYGSLRRFKIALKDVVRHVPGAGWAMQAGQFAFLKRNWQVDKGRVEVTLKRLQKNCLQPQLLFFPEGTDLQSFSRQKSREYAEKNELDDYDFVLHPRTLGFTAVVNYMKSYNDLDQIIDVTVAYPKTILQKEADLITGNIPREIVFTVRCYDLDEVPTDHEHRLTRWLEGRWKEKEEFLRKFYDNKEYSGNNGYTKEQNVEIERDTQLYLLGAIIFWSIHSLIVLYLLFNFQTFRMLYFVLFVLCVMISTVFGFDGLFYTISVK